MTVLLYSVMCAICCTWVIGLVVEAISSEMLRTMSPSCSTELILHPPIFSSPPYMLC